MGIAGDFMKRDIRILLLEDSLLDAYLVEHTLETAGLSFQLVQIETERELRRELETARPDLVISDHGFPSFDGFAALDIVRKKSPDLPFIFISGSNDQGMICRMFEKGATDYVFKKELPDLSLAVCRALTPSPETLPSLPDPKTPKALEEPKVLDATEEVEEIAPSAEIDESLPALIFEPAPLLFCPQCLQARSASGSLVQILDYLRGDADIAFLRQPCAECSDWSVSG